MIKRRVPAAALVAAIAMFVFLQASSLGQSTTGRAVGVSDPVPQKARVIVKDNYFEPRSVEVLVGGVVTWKWHGQNRHNIRFTKVPDGASRKGARTRDEGRWRRTFKREGVYRYVCKLWSGMRGSVSVKATPPEPPS
jgi:plastocyanin